MPGSLDPPVGEDDLHALVDGALRDPARLAAVRRWVEERPEAAARLRAYAAQRDALRAALAPKAAEPIPARLRIAHLRAARRGAMRARLQAVAAMAGLVLLGAGLGWTARGPVAPRTEIAASAVPPAPFEARPQATDLAAWLSDRLGEGLAPPDLAPFGFAPLLARVVPGADGPSALLRYRDAEGAVVSLWRHPTRDPVPRELRCTDEPGGLVTYTWSDGRRLHVVTAALPRDRLRPIALAVERAFQAPLPPDPPLATDGTVMAGMSRRPCDLASLG